MIGTFFARTSSSILLILFGLLLACSHSDDVVATKFIQDIASAYKGLKTGQDLRMDAINKGEWNQMFIFPPYTPLAEIEAVIRTRATSAIAEARVSERDDINLFVFLRDENIQIVAAVPRKAIDISVDREIQPVSRSAAVFRYVGAGLPLALASSK